MPRVTESKAGGAPTTGTARESPEGGRVPSGAPRILPRGLPEAGAARCGREGPWEDEHDDWSSIRPAGPGVAHLDREGRWVEVNPQLCELTGYAREELLGRSFALVLHGDEVAGEAEAVERLWAGESSSWSREIRCFRKDGEERWVNVSASVTQDDAGEPLHLRAVFADVTDRKVAELALRESELRFEQLAANLPQVHWMISLETRQMLYVSPAYEEVWGRSRESLIREPRSWSDAIHPDDRDRVVAAQGAAMRERVRGRYDQVYRIVRPDGEVRWVRDRAFPVRGADGEVRRMAGMAEDVTSEVRREARLRHLASAVDQATDAVFVTDSTGAVEYANPSFERITGYDRRELLGRDPRFLQRGAEEEDVWPAVRDTLAHGRSWHGRVVHRRTDGSRSTHDAVVTPVRSDGGEIEHFVGVLRDVTRELELERQVLQAQKMEAVGRLAGGVAHDVNNVLTAIKGHAALALDGVDSGAVRDEIRQILGAADLAHNVTRQLLTFSRQREARPEPVEVRTLLEGAELMLGRLIGEDVELEVSAASDVGWIRADPTQISQVLVNLAVNARDAMPDGGRLVIRAEALRGEGVHRTSEGPADPGDSLLLTIRDTGVGMAEDALGRAFDPFFTTKPPGKGTGLGLSTVLGIVEQHGGSIRVESRPGEGTTFRVRLPSLQAPPEKARPSGGDGVRVPGGRGTILVVEDQDMVRSVVRRILERGGHRVLEAGDGEEALEVLAGESGCVDLVLSDVIMPRMGGVELTRELIRLHPELPVLLMSGHSADERSEVAGLRERAGFLDKPFEATALAEAVGGLLSAE